MTGELKICWWNWKNIGYKLQEGLVEPKIESYENKEHFGINKSKVAGESYIGFANKFWKSSREGLPSYVWNL